VRGTHGGCLGGVFGGGSDRRGAVYAALGGGGPRERTRNGATRRVRVNAALPVPTACSWKPVTRHRRHRWGARPGGGCGEGVLRECTLRNFLASRTGPFVTVVCQSSVAVVGARLRITPFFFFYFPSPVRTANVADNSENNVESASKFRGFHSLVRARRRRSTRKAIVVDNNNIVI